MTQLWLLPAGDVLEGFDRHPPLILPSSGFQLELRGATAEPALLRQLRRLQAFICRLPRREGGANRGGVQEQVRRSALIRTQVDVWYRRALCVQTSAGQAAGSASTRGEGSGCGPRPSPEPGCGSDLSGCQAVLTQKLKSLELQTSLPGRADLLYHKSLALDPSCLLTPPNTPQGSEEAQAHAREGARQRHKGRT